MKRIVAIGNASRMYIDIIAIILFFSMQSLTVLLISLMFGVIHGIVSIVFVVLSLAKKCNLENIPRTNMIMRMAQLPAYVIMCLWGFSFLSTIFTAAFSFVVSWVLINVLITTGLYVIPTFLYMKIEGKISRKMQIVLTVLSFFFIADYVVSIVGFIKNGSFKRKITPILICILLTVALGCGAYAYGIFDLKLCAPHEYI